MKKLFIALLTIVLLAMGLSACESQPKNTNIVSTYISSDQPTTSSPSTKAATQPKVLKISVSELIAKAFQNKDFYPDGDYIELTDRVAGVSPYFDGGVLVGQYQFGLSVDSRYLRCEVEGYQECEKWWNINDRLDFHRTEKPLMTIRGRYHGINRERGYVILYDCLIIEQANK